jgi:hypothetical protein
MKTAPIDTHLNDSETDGTSRDAVATGVARLGITGVFDDHGFPACPGIDLFVDERRARPSRIVLQALRGHGSVVTL